jgi:hypothetical protein
MLCREDLSTKVKKTEAAEAEGARLELLHTSAWFSVGNKCCGRGKAFQYGAYFFCPLWAKPRLLALSFLSLERSERSLSSEISFTRAKWQ